MNLVLTDEQKLLRESAARLAAAEGGAARHRKQRDAPEDFDRARLAAMAAAGWLSILVPETQDGAGLGMVELSLVLEEVGRSLMMEPLAALAGAGWALAQGQRRGSSILTPLLAGERIVLPALSSSETALPAVREEHGRIRLNGTCAFVPHAGEADDFLLPARTERGVLLCLLPAMGKGVSLSCESTVDGGHHGMVTLESVEISEENVVTTEQQGAAVTAGLYDRLLLGYSAEMLGVMRGALDLGLEYIKVREQFGRPIGSFQALQHRAVDNHIDVELSRSLIYQVATALDSQRSNRLMAAAAKARVSEAVLSVAKSVIQMHGAIGFTDEYDAGLYLRRAMVLSSRLGNAAAQRSRFARLADADT